MSGTLYIVATPIGNLEDITLRALNVLKSVDLIAAEDTRVTHILLAHYGIDTPTTPYHQHSLGQKAAQLIEKLQSGSDIAVVSDAGMPGISDPGHEIIQLAIQNDVAVVVIPGASAILTALVESGLPTRRFTFEGFLPRKGADRRTRLRELATEPRTMVFYESPHRIIAALKDMKEVLGDRPLCFMREATKKFEEVHRGTAESALRSFDDRQPRGEFTLVVAGCSEETPSPEDREDIVDDLLKECLAQEISERDAVRKVSETLSIPKKEVYRRMLDLKRDYSPDE